HRTSYPDRRARKPACLCFTLPLFGEPGKKISVRLGHVYLTVPPVAAAEGRCFDPGECGGLAEEMTHWQGSLVTVIPAEEQFRSGVPLEVVPQALPVGGHRGCVHLAHLSIAEVAPMLTQLRRCL